LQRLPPSTKSRRSIFISGAAEEYGKWTRKDAESFIQKLSHQIAEKKNRVITGFGVGVGGAVINGAFSYPNEAGPSITERHA
jgi:Sir2- and TIR-associating SLOG family